MSYFDRTTDCHVTYDLHDPCQPLIYVIYMTHVNHDPCMSAIETCHDVIHMTHFNHDTCHPMTNVSIRSIWQMYHKCAIVFSVWQMYDKSLYDKMYFSVLLIQCFKSILSWRASQDFQPSLERSFQCHERLHEWKGLGFDYLKTYITSTKARHKYL